MGVDRTAEYWAAVDAACTLQGVPEERAKEYKSAALLKPISKASGFSKISASVVESIQNLKEFISTHQKDYLAASNGYSDREKDSIEAEVGAFVKVCTQQIEQLKNGVLAAQGSPDAPPAAVAALKMQQQQQQQQGAGEEAAPLPRINEQTAAHLHGVVLLLAERLHAVSSRFDKCRAHRYNALAQRETALRAATHAAAAPRGKAGAPCASSKDIGPGSGPGDGNPVGTGAAAGAARIGSVLFKHVKGAASEVVKGAGSAVWARAGLGAAGGQEAEDSGGALAGVAQGKQQPGMTTQQMQLEAENHDLVEQLMSTASRVSQVERTVREIATLNQMFSTAVLHQAEAIEAIYNNAVEASHNIKSGNVSLKKTVAINRSTQRHILVLLLAASVGLLFLDWFNS